jgi:hypothetical protein
MSCWRIEDVRAGVAAFVAEQPEDGTSFEVSVAYSAAAYAAVDGGVVSLSRPEQDRMWGQVKRELDYLAGRAGGHALVKVGKGQYHPAGWQEHGAAYYTPRNYELAGERAKSQWRERDELERRWTVVRARVIARGIAVESAAGQPVQLAVGEWEKMLAMPLAGRTVLEVR